MSLSIPEPDLVSLSEPFRAVLPLSPDSRSVPCYPFCSHIANYLSADFWICLLGLTSCTLPTVCLFIWPLKLFFTLPGVLSVCIRVLIPVANTLNSDIHNFKLYEPQTLQSVAHTTLIKTNLASLWCFKRDTRAKRSVVSESSSLTSVLLLTFDAQFFWHQNFISVNRGNLRHLN